MNEHDAMYTYAMHLSQQGSLSLEDAKTFVKVLWPDVELLDVVDGLHTYKVTAPALSSTFGGILSGDTNAREHTQVDGITQTVVIIGMCAAVACAYKKGYALAKIAPDVSFSRPLPLGAPALMTIKEARSRGGIMYLELSGYLADTRDRIFKPRVLTMVAL